MRVLLATDGSKNAREAALWLREFPLPADTALAILSVATLRRPPIGVPPNLVKSFRESAREHARKAAKDARDLLQARWPEIEIRVEEAAAPDDPRETIVRATEGADLVVLGARGLGGVRGFLLGSVSTAVVRHAHCPVLVTKGTPRHVRDVLVGVDGSEDSLNAVRFLASLGGLRDAKVRLVGVLEELRTPSSAPRAVLTRLKPVIAEALRGRKRDLERVVAKAATPLKGVVGGLDVGIAVGHPAEQLVRAARERACDLVVVGARGLGVMKRLVLGSVSERVVHHARCPVLVVRSG